jgi:hypothetical protein
MNLFKYLFPLISLTLLIIILKDIQIVNWQSDNQITQKDWFAVFGQTLFAAIFALIGYSFVQYYNWLKVKRHEKQMTGVITELLIELRRQTGDCIEQLNIILQRFRDHKELPEAGILILNVKRLLKLDDKDMCLVIKNPKAYTEIINVAESLGDIHGKFGIFVSEFDSLRRKQSVSLNFINTNSNLLAVHLNNLQQMINACNMFLGEPKENNLKTKPVNTPFLGV